MKPLDRVEALLLSLTREPKTFYALYRTTPGCAYTSLKKALRELQERGLIEEIKEEKIGGERRIYRVTEKGRNLLQTLITQTPTVSITDVKV
jgi:DNA-binding HxlR family transcriptional regulator